LSALGWIVYRRSYLAGHLTPTDKDAYADFKKNGAPPPHHPAFSPLVYSIENALPLVKLGQADKWRPDPRPDPTAAGDQPFVAFGKMRPWPSLFARVERCLVSLGLRANTGATRPRFATAATSARLVRWFLWAQILIGWLLATLVVAGVSALLRKE
jgi:hypothetical protein